MKETGKITAIHNNIATVEMKALGGCKSCALAGGCHVTGPGLRKLHLNLGGRSYEVGDLVEIETPARSFLTAAFLVFIFPLIIAFLAYWVMDRQTGQEGLSILSFFLSFGLAELLIALIDKRFGRGQYFQPRIVDRVERAADAPPE